MGFGDNFKERERERERERDYFRFKGWMQKCGSEREAKGFCGENEGVEKLERNEEMGKMKRIKRKRNGW